MNAVVRSSSRFTVGFIHDLLHRRRSSPSENKLRAGLGNVGSQLRASSFRNPAAKNSQEALLFVGGQFVCGINDVGEGWHR
jgi:hypothetical protein